MSWTRREFLTRTAALGAFAAAPACSSAMGGSPRPDPAPPPARRSPTSSSPSRAPTVRLGIARYQPYTVEQNGEATGPVPDLARAVLARMGHTDVGVELFRDEAPVVAGLTAERFDLVGGVTVRGELCAGARFSLPATISGTALIVPSDNPTGLRTFAEVVAAKAKVAVMTGLPDRQDALRAGVPAANLVELPVAHQLVDAVRSGQADCAAFDDIAARDMARVIGDGDVSATDSFFPSGRPPVMGVYLFGAASAAELLEPFNAALRELRDSADWLDLVEPFGFTTANRPPPELTAQQACG
jgi:polar amino acid transport system substrate-binding protein